MNATMETVDLNQVMEFDHVVRVHPDGTVTDAEPGHYAPEVYHEDIGMREEGYAWSYGDTKWRLMRGYTGQYSYDGPVMHPSEFIGGGLARDILATPGLYVVTAVECLDCELCEDGADNDADCTSDYPHHRGQLPGCACEPECLGEHEPAGWAIAYIPDEV